MTETPWAAGLSRLLAERRGIKKGAVAKLAGVRAGTITALLKEGGQRPHVKTLMAVASALTAMDRQGNPTAPDVPIWEFFVSDEQSDLLRAEAAKQARQPDVIERLAQMQDTIAALQQQLTTPASQQPKRGVK